MLDQECALSWIVRSKAMKKITVFTPTYNRAYILDNLYESLRRQSFQDFEWLIIDDGSIDNTEELVRGWIAEENKFPIRYYKVPNGGKCRAINRALELAQGELFFTVDSDDYLTDDALEKVDYWFQNIDSFGSVQGVVANRGYTEKDTMNYLFEEEYLDKSLLEIYSFKRDNRQVFDGERAFIFYTEFHKKYRYPEFENERFMTEAVAWNRMAADGYKMRFYNDIIWVFEYKEDGLTKAGSRMFLDNPRGYGLWLREKAEFEKRSFIQKLRMIYTFTCDLSEVHNLRTIADSIGSSMTLVWGMWTIHRIMSKLHKYINRN